MMIPPTGQTFARQRMVKSGGYMHNGQSIGTIQLTGWASDATWPGSVSGNALVVQGSGTVALAWSMSGSGGNTTIRLNGTQIASGRSGSQSITVDQGDALTVWVAVSYGVNTTVQTGSWLEVAPA